MKRMITHAIIRSRISELEETTNDVDIAVVISICRDLLNEIENLEERLEMFEPEVI